MKAQQTQFHIHVDAIEMDGAFEEYLLKERDFYRVAYSIDRDSVDLDDDCAGHQYHLTHKTTSPRIFNATCRELFEIIEANAPIHRGYVECEYVSFHERLDFRPYCEAPIPFHLRMVRPLPATFRESEIHITLSRDESDPHLLHALHSEIGMISGFIPKTWGMAQVFTAQGSRRQIDEIREPLRDYLHRAGGAARCAMKEERTVRYWLSHPAGIGLPRITDRIEPLADLLARRNQDASKPV